MRHRSKKQSALYRQYGPERAAYLRLFPWCAVCGSSVGVAVHEIAAGSNRMRAFGLRHLWLTACGRCNCGCLTDPNEWPIARQLALKRVVDPEYFDLSIVNKVFAPEGARVVPQRFTLDDLAEAIDRFGDVA